MLILIVLYVMLISVAEYFLLVKYIKIDVSKRFYVLFCTGCALSEAAAVILQIKQPNLLYNYSIIIFLGLLECLAIEDIVSMKLDRILLYILAFTGIAVSFTVPDAVFWKIILVAATISAVLLIFSVLSKEAVGKGDVICIGAAALCFSFSNAFNMVIYTFFSSLVYGIVKVIMKKMTVKQDMPFIPFLVIGIFITLTLS